jgi:hypothetical protein
MQYTPMQMFGASLTIVIAFYIAVNNADNRVILVLCAIGLLGLLALINLQYNKLHRKLSGRSVSPSGE